MMNKYTTTLPASQQQDLATLQSFISAGGQSRDRLEWSSRKGGEKCRFV